MKKFIRTPRALLLGVTALAVVLVGAGVASGTIGASKPNVYWACVPKDGRIKLVYPGSKCKPGERFITWHQKGQQSATVVQDGLQGLKGDAGAQGEAGAAGAKGTDGASGPQGAKGDKGENGAAGPKGDAGVDGLNGADGAQRRRTVLDGATGPKGDAGAAGPQGEIGPAGPQGAKGEHRCCRPAGCRLVPTAATAPRVRRATTGSTAGPQGPTGDVGAMSARRVRPARTACSPDIEGYTAGVSVRSQRAWTAEVRIVDVPRGQVAPAMGISATPSARRSRLAHERSDGRPAGLPSSFQGWLGSWR